MVPAATITLCRLYAGRHVPAERVALRGRGITSTGACEVADQAARIVDALDGVCDLRVDTDDRPADEIAAEIPGRTGWPSLSR